jgi:hypothetical protein
MFKMYAKGVELGRRSLNDRHSMLSRGDLAICNVTDLRRRRPVRVARLQEGLRILYELVDVRVV